MHRCGWAGDDPLCHRYHDEEWGVPNHDDGRWFEMLILEGVQAGLSWITVLRKRDAYRQAYDGFDVAKVAAYDDARIAELLENPGLVRNRLKISASVQNARAFLKVQAEFGSFDAYIWRFVDGKPLVNTFETYTDAPAQTPLSQTLSKDLKKRGFNFVGPTICYALMQACGMVNDHERDCFRYDVVNAIIQDQE